MYVCDSKMNSDSTSNCIYSSSEVVDTSFWKTPTSEIPSNMGIEQIGMLWLPKQYNWHQLDTANPALI